MSTATSSSKDAAVKKTGRRTIAVKARVSHALNGSRGAARPANGAFPDDPPGLGRNHPLYKTLGALADAPEWEDYLEHIRQARKQNNLIE